MVSCRKQTLLNYDYGTLLSCNSATTISRLQLQNNKKKSVLEYLQVVIIWSDIRTDKKNIQFELEARGAIVRL